MASIRSYYNYLFKKHFLSQRTIVLYILLFLFIDMMMAPIKAFSREVGIDVSPWGFPLWLCNNYFSLLFILIYLFWIAEFPVFERNQMFVILRIGKVKWIIGQVLYLISSGFIYIFSILVLGNLYLLPVLRYENDWGKVWGTLTDSNLCYSYGILMNIPYEVVSLYNPIALNLLMLFICSLVTGMLAVVMLVANRYSKLLGISLITFFAFLNLTSRYFEDKWLIISPVSWLQIKYYRRTMYPDRPGFLLVIAVSISIIIISSIYISISAKKLEFDKLK